VTAPTIKAAGKTLTNATDGIQALDKQTVQYGTNADGTVDYTAAAMLGKGGTQISNVKAGTLPNDAANTQQVADGVTEAKTYAKTQDAILGTSTAAGLGGGSAYDAVTGKVTAPTIKAAGKTLTNATDGIQALDKQTVQYGTNADGTVDYTTAAMLGKGGTQISNVKAGTLPNDAANTQQVTDGVTAAKTYADTKSLAAEQNAIKSSNGYTDTQVGNLDAKTQAQIATLGNKNQQQFKDLSNQIKSTGSIAAAMSGLVPNARSASNLQVQAALGVANGSAAIGSGLTYQVSNDTLIVGKIGVSTTKGVSMQNRVGGTVGISLGL
jgi:hypothetical protein